MALIVEKGFDETSMNDVAARSGLSRTTVFNHFPRKMAFLDEWALRRRERAASSFAHDPAAPLPLREVLGRYLAALADLNVETRRETVALMPPRLRHTDWLVTHPLVRDLAEFVIDSGVALRPHAGAGPGRPDAGARLLLGRDPLDRRRARAVRPRHRALRPARDRARGRPRRVIASPDDQRGTTLIG